MEPNKNPFDMIVVNNILGVRFDFGYDGHPFYVAAKGEPNMQGQKSPGYEIWPRELAEHCARHMAKKWIMTKEPYQDASGNTLYGGPNLLNEELEASIINRILGDVNAANTDKPASRADAMLAAMGGATEETESFGLNDEATPEDIRRGELAAMSFTDVRKAASEMGIYKVGMNMEATIEAIVATEFGGEGENA